MSHDQRSLRFKTELMQFKRTVLRKRRKLVRPDVSRYPRGHLLFANVEDGHGGHQVFGLPLQTRRGSSHLFDQGRILLGDLVHLDDCRAHLRHAQPLFFA